MQVGPGDPRVERDAVDLIAGSPEFAARVTALSAETGRTSQDIESDARACLAEMAAQVGPQATEVWDRFGRWLARAYDVDADEKPLSAIRALGREHSLVFLPNHRSYLDPLVLRRVLDRHDFPPNHILGGINLAMWPLSEIAKRAGLVFIRRSTRNDPVYPAMLRLYLGFLLRIHGNLEWYFEGGRTRTGKLRPPKMGVLRYLVDAFVESDEAVDDVYLVPVSIVYDQQHEVSAISAEEGGGTKAPESISWLWRFARAQSSRRGLAHVRFGQPLSLREALDDASERAGSAEPQTVVPRVAFEIAHRINDATPITPAALVTFSLLDNDGRALTLTEVLGLLEPLLAYVRSRGLPLTAEVDLARPDGLRRALRILVAGGVVDEYRGGTDPVYSIASGRQHEAGFYRNTVTHWFVNRAICEVAVVRAAETEAQDVPAAVWESALALRDLLKYEFFFPRKREFDQQIRLESDIAVPGWEESELRSSQLMSSMESTGLLIAHRVIGPFIEAYQVVADRLVLREPAAPVDRDALVTECLGIAQQRWLQHGLHSPESISKDLMSSALRLAGNRKLLEPGGEDLRAARQAFADELRDVARRVAVLRRMASLDAPR